MRGKITILIILLSCCLLGQVLAYEETIEYSEEILAAQSLGWGGVSAPTDATLDTIWFPAIENYKYLYAFEWIETGTAEVSAPASHSGEFIAKYEATAEVVGSGYIQYITSEDNVHDRFYLIFTDWDIGTYTGSHYVTIEYTPTNCMPVKGAFSGGAYQWISGTGGITSPVFGKDSSSFIPRSLHETIYDVRYKASINITNMGNFGGVYDVVDILFSRDVEGVSYPSTIDARVNDTLVFIDNVYATSGNTEALVNWYPTELTVTFGYPTAVYTWEKTLYGDNPTYPATPGVTPTPTITPTATPTPDISSTLCGYWAFSVNTSNVVRMGYVTGTLTEADPDNKHKKIDWYIVLPTGQEITKKSFVYDDGFFGLGAGWIEIGVSTGSVSASSEAAAKANSLQYVMAGNNQKMRVKIYEDKSLIPLAYHDYNLFCTLDQTVHVSETTQGLSVWNINAYDQLTNNLISGITVHLYDYQSGEWQNKTTLIGGSYQFNVVPGNKYRIYIDESYWNTYDEDYTIPSPVPSQPYPVYLIRPLEAIEDASWVMFYVRDGSTLNLMGGVSIALSDGQIQSTSGSGFAKFNVSDSTLYYWSASKTGYTGQSGTFNISSDTLLPDVYLYPAGVVTTPTTIPYWTQTPTPLPTYANGTVIPGYTYAPMVTATLNVVERDQKLTESTDIWYRFAPFLSQLIFIVVVVGLLGLMTKSLGGGGSGGRRRRY